MQMLGEYKHGRALNTVRPPSGAEKDVPGESPEALEGHKAPDETTSHSDNLTLPVNYI